MREIKFRAWDEVNKKIYQVVRLDFSSTIVILVDEKNTILEVHRENLELMQFTGLKDKNGKEICEGDILKDENAVSQVVWKDGCLGTIFVDQPDKTFVGMDMQVETGYIDGFEVLGNIYENPELLK